MVNFATRIPDCKSHSLALLDLFLFSWVFQIVVRSTWVGRVRNFIGGEDFFYQVKKQLSVNAEHQLKLKLTRAVSKEYEYLGECTGGDFSSWGGGIEQIFSWWGDSSCPPVGKTVF